MNRDNQKKAGGRVMVGKVLSVKMDKTVIIGVVRTRKDPLYKKSVRRLHKFAAHNEIAGIGEGDEVQIQEVRPISKTKHFIVIGKVTG